LLDVLVLRAGAHRALTRRRAVLVPRCPADAGPRILRAWRTGRVGWTGWIRASGRRRSGPWLFLCSNVARFPGIPGLDALVSLALLVLGGCGLNHRWGCSDDSGCKRDSASSHEHPPPGCPGQNNTLRRLDFLAHEKIAVRQSRLDQRLAFHGAPTATCGGFPPGTFGAIMGTWPRNTTRHRFPEATARR
jgi:hypothetical protein